MNESRAGIIRTAFKRTGVKSDLAISQELGMDYKKLHYRRMKDIGAMTLNELWLLQRHAYFTDQELLEIVREGGSHARKQTGHMQPALRIFEKDTGVGRYHGAEVHRGKLGCAICLH